MLFELVDLKNDPVPGKYYKQQLVKSPPPNEIDYFYIEKILKKRTINRKQQYFVKYLYYPSKFNKWIDAKNVVVKDT